jgi:hypothetical protein
MERGKEVSGVEGSRMGGRMRVCECDQTSLDSSCSSMMTSSWNGGGEGDGLEFMTKKG